MDLKTSSCPGKIAEQGQQQLNAATPTGSNASNTSQRLRKDKQINNSVQVQLEKWTSNITKLRERRTYNTNTVNLKLPRPTAMDPYKRLQKRYQENKGQVNRKKMAACITEACKLEELSKSTEITSDRKTIQDNIPLSEVDNPGQSHVLAPTANARPKTPTKHDRGEVSGRSFQSDGNNETYLKQEPQITAQPLEGSSKEKGAATRRPIWRTLSVPPPSP